MTHKRLKFTLQAEASSSMARAGRIDLRGQVIETPIFMPVGTHACVRHLHHSRLEQISVPIILGNTFHLLQRPGIEVFKQWGGIHQFMNWKGLVLTDSGGFQIFSLSDQRRMTEEGAKFKSYYDGSDIFLSPEKSIEMQGAINSDIMMVLDECVPSTVDEAEAKRAMDLTHRWAKRSLDARTEESTQALFAIVQGAIFPNLRRESAKALTDMPFDGFAIGGLAVGESKGEREAMTEFVTPLLPKESPRYLMGVGTPIDLLEAVHRGVDMFDCILPGALGEQGVAFSYNGKIKLKRASYKFDSAPLDESCDCDTCKMHSRSYLHHLIKGEETVGKTLLTQHNIHFYLRLMRDMRKAILENRFLAFYNEYKSRLVADDEKHPIKVPKTKPKRLRPTIRGAYQFVKSEKSQCYSIKHIESGEVMHSSNDPSEEAQKLYADQSRFELSLFAKGLADTATQAPSPLVIWDVGLGAAFNAMSAIRNIEKIQIQNGEARSVKIISFENDLDPLKLCLQNHSKMKHLWHPGPAELVEKNQWRSLGADGNLKGNSKIDWQLILGDFETLNLEDYPAPDLIYFDPFSSKVNSSLWSITLFEKLFELSKIKNHALMTYSASTAIRSLLMVAGYEVGKGSGTGLKEETTIARTPDFALFPFDLLDDEWFGRWQRSSAKFPNASDPIHIPLWPQWEEKIRKRFSSVKSFVKSSVI